LWGIKDNSSASLLFLRGKTVLYCIANLIIGMPGLEADLIAYIVGIKEEGLNT
jgi:hypothetical protein